MKNVLKFISVSLWSEKRVILLTKTSSHKLKEVISAVKITQIKKTASRHFYATGHTHILVVLHAVSVEIQILGFEKNCYITSTSCYAFLGF